MRIHSPLWHRSILSAAVAVTFAISLPVTSAQAAVHGKREHSRLACSSARLRERRHARRHDLELRCVDGRWVRRQHGRGSASPTKTTTGTSTTVTTPGTTTPGTTGTGTTGTSTTTSTTTVTGTTGTSTTTGTGTTGTTGPTAGGAGWAGFGGGEVPGADWRPYSAASPFNQTVAGATVVPNSAAIVQATLQWGTPGNLVADGGASNDYGHPTYYAQPTDPIYTLRSDGGTGAFMSGMQIPVPAGARPAGGGDGHMTVITPDGWEYDFWQVQSMSDGVLVYNGGGRTRIDGTGLGSGATASLFGNLAGMIRAPELIAGHIDHALFLTVKCTNNSTSFGYGTQASAGGTGDGSYVYPAEHGGSACSSDPNLPPLGARFMLAMSSAQIQGLNVPTWDKTILTALATYGGYVGDTGGPGIGFMFESDATYTSLGQSDPLVTFARENNLPTWNGQYVFNVAQGVDWEQYLRVIAPPSQS